MKKKTLVILLYISWLKIADTNSSDPSETWLVTNAPNNLISMVNRTVDAAGVWDPSSYSTSLFNGRNGSVIKYDVRNNSGIYIPGRLSIGWNSTTETWPNYFHNFSLGVFFNNGTTSFTVDNASSNILHEIAHVLSNLSPEYVKLFANSTAKSLSTLAHISRFVSDLYNGPLESFLPMIGSRIIPVWTDFLWMTEFFEGMSLFFHALRGGIATLQNFEFDPVPVLYARNGMEALTCLLTALGYSFNLNDLLDDCLNMEAFFWELVTKLGGNVVQGVNGQFRAMYELSLMNQTSSYPLRVFLQNSNAATRNEWMESVASLQNITDQLNENFDGFRGLVRGLQGQGNGIYRSVNYLA